MFATRPLSTLDSLNMFCTKQSQSVASLKFAIITTQSWSNQSDTCLATYFFFSSDQWRFLLLICIAPFSLALSAVPVRLSNVSGDLDPEISVQKSISRLPNSIFREFNSPYYCLLECYVSVFTLRNWLSQNGFRWNIFTWRDNSGCHLKRRIVEELTCAVHNKTEIVK